MTRRDQLLKLTVAMSDALTMWENSEPPADADLGILCSSDEERALLRVCDVADQIRAMLANPLDPAQRTTNDL